MEWLIKYSKESEKFINNENINRSIIKNLIIKTLLRLKGEKINLDLKKLKGKWEGFYRIRKREIRVIVTIDFKNKIIFVYSIDFRGSAYK
ncbi:MAG TPA: cytotoxic translational repressor of toxin-antitoxin stability system [Caldisericia bacterium]|nr:cytotoxic translational repressor of toxin-antitoxin stability system [Caldisericia bacterium]HPB34149.1 cytotoxic translational repressor of toxin-antitoxin stability system [Caldisericia bacterium]HQL65973.1 cytotoxic translational repressor of toxin-antitoxin stability system [Caldisericia bacterium]HQN48530.1 cytotoxic translational repressor of toxin-antitoxin stability system [Caldisericia bacterium]HQO99659.1 cytotoxic translational repressor of toxin-antitoxin stability system [Caldi